MQDYSGEPRKVELSQSPILPICITDKFAKNACLNNSYITSKYNHDLMVEGVILILSGGKVASVVAHCWNKNIISGEHYDVTKDYLWEKDEQFIDERIKDYGHDVSYIYYACVDYVPEDIGVSDDFLYSFDSLIQYFKSKLFEQ